MSNRSSQDEQPTRSTTNTQTFLETCVLNADHRSLEEHLVSNPVQQSDLDRCLLRGLRMVQRKERELLHMAPVLTLLLQSSAKWNSDVLLDHQKTPYHIICESPGDHHELLDLMIKSSQRTIIDIQDNSKFTALLYAVHNANINCLKCLITNGADVHIGYRSSTDRSRKGLIRSIVDTLHILNNSSRQSSVIMHNIFDVLVDAAVDQGKDYFRSCTHYILHALFVEDVNCIKKLINIGVQLDVIPNELQYVWAMIAENGNKELLKCMINRGIDKDSVDLNGFSILSHVVLSGNTEAVRYLLDIGVAIPTYEPEEFETPCERCKEDILIIDHHTKQYISDPCVRAICDKNVEIVQLLDEHGSKYCKSFSALRNAVTSGSADVMSFLLSKYIYPLNMKYIINDSDESIFTLLTESPSTLTARIAKILLDHGADPAKPICAAKSTNAIMTAIMFGQLEVIAQYIRCGGNINFRSWDFEYGRVLPFEASVLRDHHYISVMLLIPGCSRGMFSIRKLEANPKPELEKLMKEWNVYDNNVRPLKQRCRNVILNHLSPRAVKKIEKLPLPTCLIKFLGIPKLDNIICKYNKANRA